MPLRRTAILSSAELLIANNISSPVLLSGDVIKKEVSSTYSTYSAARTKEPRKAYGRWQIAEGGDVRKPEVLRLEV